MNYHLVGIGGISMSGLAKILKGSGHQISGCDLAQEGHSPNHIAKDLDGLIISAAITKNSPGWVEVEKAKKLGIPVISRSKMIGKLMTNKTGIAIAGMHGKTTVSAMIALILEEARLDPTFLIGGELDKLGNAKLGKGEYFIAEACEYARQFLDFRPKIALITNIEEEHLDTYPGGLSEIVRAFKKFVKLLPKNGLLVVWEEDEKAKKIVKSAQCKVKTFHSQKPWPGLKLKIPGKHNLLNATAAARVCHEIGIPHNTIKKALNNFPGVKRRFEIKGEEKGILVIDDYGHHPSEIQATLAGASEFYPKHRIVCVFQPHQYSRTKLLLKDFGRSFKKADLTIVAEIYAVPGREEKREVSTEDLVKEIKKHLPAEASAKAGKKDVIYKKSYQEILRYLKKEAKKGDLVITMGATEIYKVGEKLLKELRIKN